MLKPTTAGLALLVPAALAVMHLVDLPFHSDIGRRFLDAMHAPVFGLLAVVALLVMRRWTTPVKAYAWAAVSMLVLGAAGEVLQYFGPRNADPLDLANDAFGIFAFLGLAAAIDPQLRPRLAGYPVLLLRSGAALLITIILLPPIWLSYSIWARSASLPSLISFDSRWEQDFYHATYGSEVTLGTPPAGWPVNNDGQLARIKLAGGAYPGIALHPQPDWRGYSRLSFIAAGAGDQPVEIILRIHDAAHDDTTDDRFNRQITVNPSPERIELALDDILSTPGGRRMDAGNIAGIIIHAANESRGRELLLDEFRLLRGD